MVRARRLRLTLFVLVVLTPVLVELGVDMQSHSRGTLAAAKSPTTLSSTTSTSMFPSTSSSTTTSAPRPVGPGNVQSVELPSGDADGSTRRVMIYRPPGADSPDLPVVYFLHGLPGASGDAFGAGAAKAIDNYVANGGKPFVFVTPDGNSKLEGDTEWADSANGKVRLETFITTTLIDAVEGNNRRPATLRTIAGYSMGGFGATSIAEKHPDLYKQLMSIDGYFHFDDPDNAFADHSQSATPDGQAQSLHGTAVLLLASQEDDDPVTRGESASFNATLDADNIPVTYKDLPGDHGWDFVAGQFPTVFAFLQQAWGG
jgi:S-formylglutathione hydrolase FrmB